MFKDAQVAAKTLGVKFQLVEVKAANPDFDGAFRAMIKERIGAVVTPRLSRFSSLPEKDSGASEQNRMPAIHRTYRG